MVSFSKYKVYFSTTVGAVVGGLSTYYGIETFYGPPSAKWDFNWDKRAPQSLTKPVKNSDVPKQQNEYNENLTKNKSKAVRHIILIRHGQYNLSGKTDKARILTELGEKQALTTGERLKELGLPYTNIIRSTMTRATQTATLIQKYLPDVPVKDCSMLEEGAPILPEPPHSTWKPDLYQVFRDGARIEAAFRKYIHRAPPDQVNDTYDIIVCHGNVIRYFVCRALQIPANAWLRFSINHASITWLSVNPNGKVILHEYSDVGHMPPKFITTS